MTKQDLLSNLHDILVSETAIKFNVDRVAAIRSQLDVYLSDDERESITNRIKDRVQQEAEYYWNLHGRKGAILAATGVGKSKIAVNISHKDYTDRLDSNGLLVVPTEKLKEVNWKDEYEKWGRPEVYNKLHKTCYVSLNKIRGKHFTYVILDELQNITLNNAKFFKNNTVDAIIPLTGTKPNSSAKVQVLKEIGINPVYELTLDEAVKLGIVAPYKITVVKVDLDDTDKYILAGKKGSLFFNTEKGENHYLSKALFSNPSSQFLRIRRMRFIYNLKSKTNAAKWLLENIIPKDSRKLIFCGSKKQAIQLCKYHYFSRPTRPKKLAQGETNLAKIQAYRAKVEEYQQMMEHWQGDDSYNAMLNQTINEMACVEAVNEGHNIPNVDGSLAVQVNSNENDLWQRIGRNIRWRPGHEANIWIICATGTQDEDWVIKSTRNLDQSRVTWVEFEEIKKQFLSSQNNSYV